MKICIITDDNAGFTQDEVNKLGIGIVPMPVIINGEIYFENKNIDQEQFYLKQNGGSDIITSQPSPGSIIELWDEKLKDFEQIVLTAQQPILVDFWAPWCVYCRRNAPVLERMDGQPGVPQIVKVNIDEAPELAQKYQVDTIPTLLLFQNGKQGQPLVAPGSQAQIQVWLKQH